MKDLDSLLFLTYVNGVEDKCTPYADDNSLQRVVERVEHQLKISSFKVSLQIIH